MKIRIIPITSSCSTAVFQSIRIGVTPGTENMYGPNPWAGFRKAVRGPTCIISARPIRASTVPAATSASGKWSRDMKSRSASPTGRGSGCYANTEFFEPRDEVKGDVARIIFYLFTRYPQSDAYDFEDVAESLELLLEWHTIDPVDEFESHRNDVIAEYQGNRNPYIDNPSTPI